MTTTNNLGITLLEQAQAQKEITINEAFTRLDALFSGAVKDKDLSTPPGSPATGDAYIVGASPTGAWAGQANAIAYFDQVWRFIPPVTNNRVWVLDEVVHYVYNGTAWVIATVNVGGAIGTLPVANGGTGQTAFTNGQLLIGNTSTGGLTKTTLTAGSNISITNAAGSITIAASGGGGGIIPLPCDGRLTLTSGVPVTTADVTAATTLYFTPYQGNRIALYDGSSAWTTLSFSELSLAVPATANTIYDIFAYNNAGTAAIEALAWTNDTTRTTALVAQDGALVKSGATTRRYLGSIRTTGSSGQTEDSAGRRYVWNYYHRRQRRVRRGEATGSWTYSTAAFRVANGNSANIIEFIVGLTEDANRVDLITQALNSTATTRSVYMGIGVDSTSSATGSLIGNSYITNTIATTTNAMLTDVPATVGRHYYSWLEYGGGADTQTWYGGSFTGMLGHVWG